MPQSNLTTEQQIKSLQFDIDHKMDQIKFLRKVIQNGNWKGYAESLKVRKSRLKEYENEVINLEGAKLVLQVGEVVKAKFEPGETYRGVSRVGYSSITVTRRTEKSIWVNGCFENEGEEVRLKVYSHHEDKETAYYHSWSISGGSTYSKEGQIEDAYYAAYHS